jgi:hypothetical protein
MESSMVLLFISHSIVIYFIALDPIQKFYNAEESQTKIKGAESICRELYQSKFKTPVQYRKVTFVSREKHAQNYGKGYRGTTEPKLKQTPEAALRLHQALRFPHLLGLLSLLAKWK